jgi:hypothetical protein
MPSLLILGLTALLLSSCGDETAPQGATISGPGDLTVTYTNWPGTPDGTASPLVFQVLDADGNPAPGVTIRFFGGGAVFSLSDRAGAALNSADATFFETTTNDQGLSPTDIYADWSVPSCSTEDITTTGSVTASVGVASAIWTVTITASAC